jgi:hypothetical protein
LILWHTAVVSQHCPFSTAWWMAQLQLLSVIFDLLGWFALQTVLLAPRAQG